MRYSKLSWSHRAPRIIVATSRLIFLVTLVAMRLVLIWALIDLTTESERHPLEKDWEWQPWRKTPDISSLCFHRQVSKWMKIGWCHPCRCSVQTSVDVPLTSPGEIFSRAVSKCVLCGKQGTALVNWWFSCLGRKIPCLRAAGLCPSPSCAFIPSETHLATIPLQRKMPVPYSEGQRVLMTHEVSRGWEFCYKLS